MDAFFKNDGGEEMENELINELERTFSQMNMSSYKEENDEHNREVEAVFEQSYLTVKVKAVLSHLDQVMEKREKW
jgi:hypothetical protein